MAIIINTKPVAHMAAQIRAKQLATRDSQNKLQQIIVKYFEDHPDVSEAKLAKEVVKNLEIWSDNIEEINTTLKTVDAEKVGCPIKYHKTVQQIDMAKTWIESKGEKFISQIKEGKFYNDLSNIVSLRYPS